jgi:hypothetical protein
MNKKIISFWWEENDLFLEDEDGEIIRLENTYISNIKYYFDDNNIETENITIVGNNKEWNNDSLKIYNKIEELNK